MNFNEIKPSEIPDNTFSLIRDDWMLVTAGPAQSFNTMTANWGGFGHLWHREVVFVFVRPQRYTYEFMERSNVFTLTFFDETWREALEFCGSRSGRNVDKVEATDLTPVKGETGGVYFEEARLVLECRTIYAQDLKSDAFIDPRVDAETYPQRDYHRLYIGQIERCLIRE
jgi:flavin reductase (DIM6/NTAB) family NADH-FMN oxidoreductase RutF